jgi:hypothetical protein
MNVRMTMMALAALVGLTVAAWLVLQPARGVNRPTFVMVPPEGNPQFRPDLATEPLPPPGTPRKIQFRQVQTPGYSSAVVSSP